MKDAVEQSEWAQWFDDWLHAQRSTAPAVGLMSSSKSGLLLLKTAGNRRLSDSATQPEAIRRGPQAAGHRRPGGGRGGEHRQKGVALEPGARGFFDSESNLPRLKSTHVADCKPQAPPGRRWDFALELGLGLFLQYFREPAGWLRS
jgi:hypothetical protein